MHSFEVIMPSDNAIKEDIKKLLSSIKKKIIRLNNHLPADIAHFWVTSTEIYDRLLWAGVSRLLEIGHVEDAVRRLNPDQNLLAVWRWNNTNYYRCKQADLHHRDGEKIDVPLDQRFKAPTPSPKKKKSASMPTTPKSTTSPKARITINPERDYFLGQNHADFISINRELEELEEKQILLHRIEKEKEKQVSTSAIATQTSHFDHPDFDEIELDPDDANYFMQGSKLDEFIRLSTAHSAVCGRQLMLIDRDTSCGCLLKQTWKCPSCNEEIVFQNCDMVRSTAIAEGTTRSRAQPDFNLRIVKGAALTGINLTKLEELLRGEMGIKIPHYRNLRRNTTKVRNAIDATFEKRKVENRREHVAAVRAQDGYKGDVKWEKDGKQYSTSAGPVSHDGAGATRGYNNRHRGRQGAFVVNSRVTDKPLALCVSQVSRLLYSLLFFAAFTFISHQLLHYTE